MMLKIEPYIKGSQQSFFLNKFDTSLDTAIFIAAIVFAMTIVYDVYNRNVC